MNPDLTDKFSIERYRPLGLVANPFSLPDAEREFDPIDLEIASHSNTLLSAIDAAAAESLAKPIVVLKSDAIPEYYPNRAISHVERSLATDDDLDVLHAYVLLFMMRMGRVRATLQTVAERLVFRDFDTTLRLYVEKVLAEPDESLIAYQVLGAEALAAYQARFAEDPTQAVADVFGIAKIERRPELAEVADTRAMGLESDVEGEDDTVVEIDAAIGDAPGTEVVLADEVSAEESANLAILDYFVEYTKVHLSPVIARGLRVYHDRGQVAMTTEFGITKAPLKTLKALVRLARIRFRKLALIYDGFDNWIAVPSDTRSQVTGTLSEVRWAFESDAVVVLLLERGGVAELEEQFGAGTQVPWDFPGVVQLEEAPDALDAGIVNRWLAAAAAPGREPWTLGDPVLSALVAESDGSLKKFSIGAGLAIENAAERGAGALDDEALAAGRAAWAEAE